MRSPAAEENREEPTSQHPHTSDTEYSLPLSPKTYAKSMASDLCPSAKTTRSQSSEELAKAAREKSSKSSERSGSSTSIKSPKTKPMEPLTNFPSTPQTLPSSKLKKQRIDLLESLQLPPESVLEKERLTKRSEPPTDS